MPNVLVVFDRKKKAEKCGKGKIEIQVRMDGGKRKYLSVTDIPFEDWPAAKQSEVVQEALRKIHRILNAMDVLGEPATLEVLNRHLGAESGKAQKGAVSQEERAAFSFPAFMRDTLEKERVAYGTMKMKKVVLELVQEFGRLDKADDFTPKRMFQFDEWLRKDGQRTDVTVYGYHKILRFYIRKLLQQGILDRNPYDTFKVSKGRYKERQPLTEEELRLMRSLRLPAREDKARNLFIFSAYTGLAYCDMQAFDFRTMTERHGDLYYIDGSRIKTETKFFTPILPPAMEVLERYGFRLPRISNQKLNDYLHLIESRMCLRKPLTFHVARHSFATLSLAHDVPIENVARMLGHTDIRTTQIYAKILKTSIERHAESLAKAIL